MKHLYTTNKELEKEAIIFSPKSIELNLCDLVVKSEKSNFPDNAEIIINGTTFSNIERIEIVLDAKNDHYYVNIKYLLIPKKESRKKENYTDDDYRQGYRPALPKEF